MYERTLLALLLVLTAPTADIASADEWGTQALQRMMREWDVKLEKMELHLRPAMRRNGVDMWIVMSREFNVDPMLQMFGDFGISGWYGHRNAYIFYDAGGDSALERVLIGTHQSGRMKAFFPTIVPYGEEGLAPHLRKFVQEREEVKPRYLPVIFCACISNLLKIRGYGLN